jgi:hypothetical protein
MSLIWLRHKPPSEATTTLCVCLAEDGQEGLTGQEVACRGKPELQVQKAENPSVGWGLKEGIQFTSSLLCKAAGSACEVEMPLLENGSQDATAL